MKKGDLIALEEGERGGEWLTGSNVLTGDWGEFPATNVRVLPAILQPPLHIIVSTQQNDMILFCKLLILTRKA